VLGLPPSLGRQLIVPLVETFRREWPKGRLAVVEGLSAHLAEWIATGRVDIGLLYNPEPHPALQTEPLRSEPLCLVGPAAARARGAAPPFGLRDLAGVPLVIPERLHATRRLLEAQAALAGVKLDIAWEISSVPAILALVRGGYGHAVLTREALAGDAGVPALVARPITAPPLVNTLCLATSSTKRATPLQRSVRRWLHETLAVARSAT